MLNSYLGKRGYTISKSTLSKEDEVKLREELMVAPIIFGATEKPTPFPVYRESSSKFYIPRFYGIAKYGMPSTCELPPGDPIHVPFTKLLREYQDKIVDVYMRYVDTPICLDAQQRGGGAILEVPCGRGKTVMALKIISLLGTRTLILVHKEFLMNQWIERIAEFLPSATVGKIQGPILDIDKDIVLGMIQTIYNKDFPPDTFARFGLTVIDEVHRIGSEQFFKTLLKTTTAHMLGISATVDRKDKLTTVLNMFIGDKIYTETREDEDPVCVRAIDYKSNCSEFNETETDFRGKPKYSTMITKLCAFGPRSDFIVMILSDLIKESPSQIMVLCHNRSLLTYLFEAINHRGFATCGYYVGGMKQVKLQETEGKQIVLATYAMAAEALDIKTLSTLVMVTPKTDIIQSVGRILRVKHESPIIVDIIDSHDLFQNQWAKRKAYYKKCNYRIIRTNNTKYGDWKTVYEPKLKQDDLSDDLTHEMPTYKCLIDGF